MEARELLAALRQRGVEGQRLHPGGDTSQPRLRRGAHVVVAGIVDRRLQRRRHHGKLALRIGRERRFGHQLVDDLAVGEFQLHRVHLRQRLAVRCRLEDLPIDELPFPVEDQLVGADALAQRAVRVVEVKQAGDEGADVRRDADEQRRLGEPLNPLTAGVAVALELGCEVRVGGTQAGEKGAIERFQPAHAVQIGVLEPRHPELQVPGTRFFTGVVGQVFQGHVSPHVGHRAANRSQLPGVGATGAPTAAIAPRTGFRYETRGIGA